MTQTTERPEAVIPRRALRYGLILAAIVAVLGAGIGFLVSGPNGLVSGLVGAVVAAIFMGLTRRASSRDAGHEGRRHQPDLLRHRARASGSSNARVRRAAHRRRQPRWIDQRVMFVSIVVAVIGSLVVDVLAFVRSRVPYVSDVPLPGPQGGSTSGRRSGRDP